MSTSAQTIEELYKFGELAPDDRRWSPGRIFAEEPSGSSTRLRIAVENKGQQIVRLLLNYMAEPFWLLYVLVVPRGEGQPGRYQSSERITRGALLNFIDRFGLFLEKDGRQNLWIKSESGPESLVWDRHDVIYAYGFGATAVARLNEAGWHKADLAKLKFPDPHSHHYHAIFDDDAKAILASMEWHHTPLGEQDY